MWLQFKAKYRLYMCRQGFVFAMQWKSDRDQVVQQGSKVIDILSKAIATSEGEDSGLPGTGCVQRAYEMLEKRFDEELGGFGKAPKFPQPSEKHLWLAN